MKTGFSVKLTVKTSTGPECLGEFYIGRDRSQAIDVFRTLLGTRDVSDNNILFLDLVEWVQEIPVYLDVISCTLQQLGENSKLITKAAFKAAIAA